MKKLILIAVAVIILILIGVGINSVFGKRSISINNRISGDQGVESLTATSLKTIEADIAGAGSIPDSSETYIAPLTGAPCDVKPFRPVAVMLSADPEARPLTGLSEADIVFEMPVINQVTRMMAVFGCHLPRKISALRSAREDYVPYVFGLDAIYVHFGGEHGVLARLNSGIVNNIDCLKYDGTTCLRDKRPRPNNAYVTADAVRKHARSEGYNTTRTQATFSFDDSSASQGTIEPPELYTFEFAVRWRYSAKTNLYSRSRGGVPEIDGNNRTQVTARNVVLLKTTQQKVSDLYNRVKTVGTGAARIYKNGVVVEGFWKKPTEKDSLRLTDKDGKDLSLAPGSTWFEIVNDNLF